MRRRAVLVSLSALPWLLRAQPALGQANGVTLAIAGAPRDGQATFRLTNRLAEAVLFASWDGGNVHNGLQQLVHGGWNDVGLGYCGLGRDGDITVPPGGSHTFGAYVGSTVGTFRITLDVRRASGASETLTSPTFNVA